MNRYKYRAINEAGKYIKGSVAAENPSELSSLLHSMHLELISFKVERKSSFSFSRKIKMRDLISMFIQLEQLDKAGVPIIESISDLKETSDSVQVKNLMHEIYESIKNGNLFSESLAKHPNIFNPIYIGLVSNGERTGHLSFAFASIVEDLKWSSDLKRKTMKATLGPLFGIFLMMVVMGVMMGVVVPKVTSFLKMQDIELPAATIALIATSDFIQNNAMLIILIFPIIFVVFKLLRRVPEFAIKIDAIKLKIPVIGPILVKIDSAKFCQFFAMTFRSGLGVIECLDAAQMVLSNQAIKRSIVIVKQQVSDGQSLAKSISQTGYFPNLVSRMFKVGEDSGNMDSSLQNIKFFYDREINDSIDRLVAMIQPALTFVMGGMISWVTIAVFGPIYGTFSKIK